MLGQSAADDARNLVSLGGEISLLGVNGVVAVCLKERCEASRQVLVDQEPQAGFLSGRYTSRCARAAAYPSAWLTSARSMNGYSP